MNKTPMQEFLEEHEYTLSSTYCQKWLEKEKQFCFDCFNAGANYNDDSYRWEKEPNFDQFYSKFTNQQK